MQKRKKLNKTEMLSIYFQKIFIGIILTLACISLLAKDQSSVYNIGNEKDSKWTEFSEADYYKLAYLHYWSQNTDEAYELYLNSSTFGGITVNKKGYIVKTFESISDDDNFPHLKSRYKFPTQIYKLSKRNKDTGKRDIIKLTEREATQREIKEVYEYCLTDISYPDAILDNQEIIDIMPKGIKFNLYLKEDLNEDGILDYVIIFSYPYISNSYRFPISFKIENKVAFIISNKKKGRYIIDFVEHLRTDYPCDISIVRVKGLIGKQIMIRGYYSSLKGYSSWGTNIMLVWVRPEKYKDFIVTR